MRRSFTLEDFRNYLLSIRRQGWADVLNSVRKVSKHQDEEALIASFRRLLGMLDAMTPAERADSALLNPTRADEIAADSGSSPEEVRRLIESCEYMRREMETMTHEGPWRRIWFLIGWKPFPPLPPPS
jgi:signal recognition particle subunit SRP54